jgi:hypothetical protein
MQYTIYTWTDCSFNRRVRFLDVESNDELLLKLKELQQSGEVIDELKLRIH